MASRRRASVARPSTNSELPQAGFPESGEVSISLVGSAENSHITDTCESRHEMRARAPSHVTLCGAARGAEGAGRPLPRPPRPPRPCGSHSRLQSRRPSPGSGGPKLLVRVALWPPPMSRLYWRNVGGAARRSRGGGGRAGAAPPLPAASAWINSWYLAALMRPDATWSKGRAEGESEGEGEEQAGWQGEGGGVGGGGGWRAEWRAGWKCGQGCG